MFTVLVIIQSLDGYGVVSQYCLIKSFEENVSISVYVSGLQFGKVGIWGLLSLAADHLRDAFARASQTVDAVLRTLTARRRVVCG